MKKTSKPKDILCSDYDFSKAERGKFYMPLSEGYTVHVTQKDGSIVTNTFTLAEGTVLLEPDVRAYFPDSESVNAALRSLIHLMDELPSKNKYRQPKTARQIAEK